MNLETNTINYDTSKENLSKLLHNFFKDYKEDLKNRKITQIIPAKLALLMNDKQLKQIITSKRIEYIITSANNKELKEIQNRINKL